MQTENRENEDIEPVDAVSGDAEPDVEEENIDPEHTVVMAEDSFADPDISMEVNVEKLVAELEGEKNGETQRKAEIRRRLEELTDDGSFEDTYAIDV